MANSSHESDVSASPGYRKYDEPLNDGTWWAKCHWLITGIYIQHDATPDASYKPSWTAPERHPRFASHPYSSLRFTQRVFALFNLIKNDIRPGRIYGPQ